MSTKPSRLLDWINDDSSSKYTQPTGPQQLAGNINDTPADPKLFNWVWWRISQWIEYIDELILDQVPEGTTYGKVKLDDLTTGRIDIDKLDQSGKTNGFIHQAGISGGKVDLDSANGVTGTLPIGNHDARVAAGLDSSGDHIRVVRTDKVAGSTTVNSNVVFNQNGVIATNGTGTNYVNINKGGQVQVGRTGNNRIDYTDSTQVLNIVGAILNTGCQVQPSSLQSGTATGVTVQSAASGARSVLSNYLSVYEDRGDTTIAQLYRQFTDNYMVDLGAGLTNPAQITWKGIRVNAGDMAGYFVNWDTSGTGVYMGGKGDQILQLQSLTGNSDYGIKTVGSFDKGFMTIAVETGTLPTHSADKGSFWIDTNADVYTNRNGSTDWKPVGAYFDGKGAILGDSTIKRTLRTLELLLSDGSSNDLEASTTSKWNGHTIAVEDLTAGVIGSRFALLVDGGADHCQLRIREEGFKSIISGVMFVTPISCFIARNQTNIGLSVDVNEVADDCQFLFYNISTGAQVDLDTLVNTGDITLHLTYLTNY